MRTDYKLGYAAALVLVCVGCNQSVKAPVVSASSSEYQQMLDELMSVETISRPPVPGSSGTTLACIYNTDKGRGIYFVNLTDLSRKELPLTNDVRRVAGWSPEGRYLVFEQKPPMSDTALKKTKTRELAEDRNESWLSLYDREKDSMTRVTTNRLVNEKGFLWLNSSNYLFCSDSDDPAFQGTFVSSIHRSSARKISSLIREFAPMSENKIAFIKDRNIHSFEIPSGNTEPKVETLSSFPEGSYDLLRWLRYSPENDRFLFCARPTNSTWRYLFEYDAQDNIAKQLNDEDTYNGQCLADGGFAYVGNSNNSFFLAIKTTERSGWTNLFTKGSVANYTVTPDRKRLYATAALGIEPQATWEYDISGRALRKVTEGTTKPLKTSRLSNPTEFKVKSFDGLEIPVFSFPPVNGIKNSVGESPAVASGTPALPSHPVVIFLPPQTFQMQRVFDTRAQMMANLGFYFVAVNYRGCDGYGKDYAKLDNAEEAARDVRAVYDEIIKNPAIDRKNIFLWTSSSGSAAGYELLATAPELWRGAVLIHPVLSTTERLSNKLPPLFLCSGDQDGALSGAMDFQKWAKANGVEVVSEIYTNAGHVNYNAAEIKDRQDKVNRFLLSHLK